MKKIIKHWKALIVAAVIAAIIPVTIFAAGGNTNTVQYNAVNKHINGTYAEPTMEGKQFKGWATTKENADAGTVDFTNDPEDITNNSLNSIKNGEQKQVYAVWGDPIKYAVELYGIGQDTDKNGNKMGLTFGPALGVDCRNEGKSHTPTGNDADGHPHRCIHNDDWETIIKWNNEDPYVYEQCIYTDEQMYYCTKAVPLNVKREQIGVLFAKDFAECGSKGDGPSVLYYELVSNALAWKVNSDSTNFNYANSRIRAVLNGRDDKTDDTYAGSDSKKFNANTCLLASFPNILQQNIGEKAVKYAPNYKTHDKYETVYDKLWLFSAGEMVSESHETVNDYYRYTQDNYHNGYYSDSKQYKRDTGYSFDKTRSRNSYAMLISTDTGWIFTHGFWLRTPYETSEKDEAGYIMFVGSYEANSYMTGGFILNTYKNKNDYVRKGISPGFALTTSYKFS